MNKFYYDHKNERGLFISTLPQSSEAEFEVMKVKVISIG